MTRYLHVTNGDCVRATISEAGIPGEFGAWAESLIDGPILLNATPEEWRQVRAHHYESMGFDTAAANLRKLESWDAERERFREFDEVVLWFEHDLFDQLLLIRHLDWFSRREMGDTRLALICIDGFPGVERFTGLGVLDAGQIATLFGTQRPVAAEQLRLGRSAWEAFGSPDPREIEAIIAGDTSSLPFLAEALRGHLAEFPSVRSGLSAIEAHALDRMMAEPMNPVRAFVDWMDATDDPYMGDSTFFAIFKSLAKGPRPLIEPVGTIDPHDDLAFRGTGHRLTDLGRRVVAGHADRVAEHGIDRHLGGVHLCGHHVPWRWDKATGRLVSA